ncbi:MAG: hypothetical protein ACX939_02000 [Hyphococcus sp.]
MTLGLGSIALSQEQNAPGVAMEGAVNVQPTAANETAEPTADASNEEQTAPNPDEVADLLNSQQQLQQTFTLRRKINGEVIETEQRTVTYDPSTPYRETEAGQRTIDRLKSTFDGELLTRKEAFEEATLDFTIADANRDNLMTADEFTKLVEGWQDIESRNAQATDKSTARQRQYEAFIAEISPATASRRQQEKAIEKFTFLSGGAETVSREDYIREYLLDFDSMDENRDTILRGDELIQFRALNRGETIAM